MIQATDFVHPVYKVGRFLLAKHCFFVDKVEK